MKIIATMGRVGKRREFTALFLHCVLVQFFMKNTLISPSICNNALVWFAVALFISLCSPTAEGVQTGSVSDGELDRICAVRIDGAISTPQVSIIRRAVREANGTNAKFLVVDLNTPGGDLESTLEIMRALKNFKGQTVCYVNSDAVSAGSFIAISCDKIFFSPEGVMGAAEAVSATGGDIDESMRRKITSYMAAKVRAANSGDTRRANVQRAMNDPDFELRLGTKILKKKGELLSLTAREACELFDGRPLLSDGICANLDELVKKLGEGHKKLYNIRITWADKLSNYFAVISPLLIGGGLLLLFMEIKSGAFGVLGALGVGLLLSAFFGARLSGLAGYEPILLFIFGLSLISLELLFFPGLMLPSMVGALAVLASLVWALSDIWPEKGWNYNLEGVYAGMTQVGVGVLISIAGVALLGSFLRKGSFWDRLVLDQTAVSKDSHGSAVHAENSEPCGKDDILGAVGECVSDLVPSGVVRVDGKLVEAQSLFGTIAKGGRVKIVSKKDFNFLVKKLD